jgi:hypothetical protein
LTTTISSVERSIAVKTGREAALVQTAIDVVSLADDPIKQMRERWVRVAGCR